MQTLIKVFNLVEDRHLKNILNSLARGKSGGQM